MQGSEEEQPNNESTTQGGSPVVSPPSALSTPSTDPRAFPNSKSANPPPSTGQASACPPPRSSSTVTSGRSHGSSAQLSTAAVLVTLDASTASPSGGQLGDDTDSKESGTHTPASVELATYTSGRDMAKVAPAPTPVKEVKGKPKPLEQKTRSQRYWEGFRDFVLCKPVVPPRKDRVIFINEPEANAAENFESNYVRTTKYTVLSFLPKNLYEQLGKAANFYFFVIAVIVSIPGVSPIAAWTSITPLAFVLSVTALREGYEDFQRYQDDQSQNSRVCYVLRDGELVPTLWMHVRIGDIVKVYQDEAFPTDLICLSSSEPTGECSIETSSLDGETALKVRQSLRNTVKLRDEDEFSNVEAWVRCEHPNSNLHYFEGVWCEPNVNPNKDPKEAPITHDELLMRGAVLMNTEYVWGLCIYAGHHSKIQLNLNDPRHKVTKVEQTTNQQMYIIFAILFFLCFTFAIVFGIQRSRQEDDWYLGYLIDGAVSDSTAWDKIVNGVRDWAAFLILFSLMVPISLYVSMELVRVVQSLWIWYDLDMYDEFSDTRAVARTASLNEQLGEIEYVFCDKTGTLTENQMAFAKCSIAGRAYGLSEAEKRNFNMESRRQSGKRISGTSVGLRRLETGLRRINALNFPEFKCDDPKLFEKIERKNHEVCDYMLALALCHTVTPLRVEQQTEQAAARVSRAEERIKIQTASGIKRRYSGPVDIEAAKAAVRAMTPRSSLVGSPPPPPDISNLMGDSARSMASENGSVSGDQLAEPLSAGSQDVKSTPGLTDSSPARGRAKSFDERKRDEVRVPISNDDVVSTPMRPRERSMSQFDYGIHGISYQASSPDEMALVTAARAFGFVFHHRERDSVRVISPVDGDQEYELLHVIEFTSERKRQSVIVRLPDGKIRLYIKGADSAILPLLHTSKDVNNPRIRKKTMEHLTVFSKMGLRVMLVASADLDPADYKEWARRYMAASRAMLDRKERMAALGAEMEQNLKLLGATAIEDKLQDGVPEAISQLRRAGLKVWILTGDKQETAVNIGKSCSLIDNLNLQYLSTGSESSEEKSSGRRKRDSVFSFQEFVKSGVSTESLRSVLSRVQGARTKATSKLSAVDEDAPHVDEKVVESPWSPEDSGIRSTEEPNQGDDAPAHGLPDLNSADLTLTRQLNAQAEYARKVFEAKEEAAQRLVQIGKNLDNVLHTLDRRQELEDQRLANRKAGHNYDFSTETKEQRNARTGSALIINGPTLGFALDKVNEDKFLKVINHKQCKVVVCARLAPKQKAAIVDLVKRRIGAVTLSIGDGANDVSMIQTAHVGVGISGREGMQAVNASDYAIGQFRFLAKLVLVHGRWSYLRNTYLVLYSFYKNFAISWTQLWFTIHAGFSDQNIFDGILLNSFNLFWCSMPILVLAAFDRDVEADDLMQYPELYKVKDEFTKKRFWMWTSLGFIHSIPIFFLPFYSLNSTLDNNSFWSMSMATYSVLVTCVTVKIVMMHNSFTWINVIFVVLSPVAWFGFAFGYSSVSFNRAFPDSAPHAMGVMQKAAEEPLFWYGFFLAVVLVFMPDLCAKYIQQNIFPTSKNIIQERRRLGLEMHDKSLSEEELADQQMFSRTLAQAAKTPSAQDLRTLGVPNASIMQAEHDAARKLKVKQANEDFEQKQAELVRAVSPMSALTSEDSARDYAERTEEQQQPTATTASPGQDDVVDSSHPLVGTANSR